MSVAGQIIISVAICVVAIAAMCYGAWRMWNDEDGSSHGGY